MKNNSPKVQKQSGKVSLPTGGLMNGSVLKANLLLKDTIYYQVNASGDYVQETN